MKLNELGKQSYNNAVDKGFYDDIRELLTHSRITKKQKAFILFLWRSNRLMLIVSELAEGLEGLRKNNISSVPKSGGLGEELADAQIRLADYAIDLNMDLEKAVERKSRYNAGREYKHGGKTA